MIGELPTALRMAAISKGEQTIAPAPEATANLAKLTAELRALFENPIVLTSSSDSEVKIVTPVTCVFGNAATAA